MSELNGAELIADYLVRSRVPYVVALCGHGDIGMLDALRARRDEIATISVHHEAAAGFIADAYYRVRRSPLATLTSCGPGSAQLLVALGAALMDSSAMLAITGNVPATQFGRAPFQELGRHYQADFPAAVRPYVKRAYQVTRTDQLPVMLPQALASTLSGRPGPVNLDVPLNVFAEPAPAAVLPVGGRPPRSGAAPADVERALDLLLDAERPVIVIGQGAADGLAADGLAAGNDDLTVGRLAADLSALSAEAGVPVISSPAGKDLGAGELYLGPAGRNGTLQANRSARNADVILALGTRFDDRSTSSWLDRYTYAIPPTRLVHAHGDAAEIGRNYPVTLGIAATVGVVVSQLLRELRARRSAGDPRARPDVTARARWRSAVAGWTAEWERHVGPSRRPDQDPARPGPMHPARVLAELRAALPRDAIVASDVGAHHNWLVQEWPPGGPGTLLQSWGFAAMGFGVAGAIGAKLAAPTRVVASVVGDGGFLMLPSAVATAVEYGVPCTWVIWNNGGYMSIRDQQRAFFGQEWATSFRQVTSGEPYVCDFAAMARAMGADGMRAETPADLGAALKAAQDSGRPTVIDVPVDAEVPQPAVATWELPPLSPPEPAFGWPDQ
ncbi:MAG: thiamine pyrophosphate-binding protein [Trebonia sp.]